MKLTIVDFLLTHTIKSTKITYLIIVLLLSTIGFSCNPFHVKIDNTKYEIYEYQATELKSTNIPTNSELNIMNWNIRFGGGRIGFYWDCYGDRTLMNQEEVNDNMKKVVDYIKLVNPDILYIQEIDINSKRSVYMDQMQYLLDETNLNYGVYAPNWKADFVPSDGHGRMNTGIAIFSKWPISDAKRIALPLIEDQAAATRYFYLRRCYLQCTIEPQDGKELDLLNIHASAWAQDDTKQQQLNIFKEAFDSLSNEGRTFIGGGDFNNIPPGSTTLTDFDDNKNCDPDFPPDDFTEQIGWMTEYYEDYLPAVKLDDYQANNASYYTYTSDQNGYWNRKLDHLFTNGEFVDKSGVVHQDSSITGVPTMPLSDHAPMTVIFKY